MLSNDILYIGEGGRVMRIRGSAYDHSKDYNPERYRKEKMMLKPGPYKSSTHGEVPLSLRGRELLQHLRGCIVELIRIGEPWAMSSPNGVALSHARGELAKYMSELEQNQKPAIGWHGKPPSLQDIAGPLRALCLKNHETAVAILREFGVERASQVPGDRLPELMVKIQAALNPFASPVQARPSGALAAMDLALDNIKLRPGCIMVDDPFGEYLKRSRHNDQLDSYAMQFFNKTPFKEIKVTNEANTETPKARSQLLSDATSELIMAQHELERLNVADTAVPLSIYIRDGGPMGSAIAPLVLEQWTALAKKAVARAKARVAKAEKAVTDLLA